MNEAVMACINELADKIEKGVVETELYPPEKTTGDALRLTSDVKGAMIMRNTVLLMIANALREGVPNVE